MRVAWKAERAGAEPGLWCYRVDTRRFVSGGALSDGGGLIGWVEKNFKVTREVELQAARMKPDSHGLTFLSLFSGERGPGWSDVSNGVIAGLSIATGPAEVLRAAMESVALRFALISEKMSGTSSEDARIVASGGGLINSSAWVGIMADTLGRTIEVPQVEEASSRGAALLALESLGYLGSGDGKFLPAGDARIVEPDAEAHEVYRKALIRHKDLYRAMIEDAPGKPG
ncbi:MAG: FGGY-family carbohydrate kinase [Rubrobacter sp.]